jgi:hypothetical protein
MTLKRYNRVRTDDLLIQISCSRNERLTEIKQIKGASETHPLLSPNDEFANFEIMSYLLGDPQGRFPHIPGSYVRDALKNGVAMQDARGFNPYKTGIVGGSDSHNTGVPHETDAVKHTAGIQRQWRGERAPNVNFRSFSLKPVPTRPANLSFPLS